jgi:hypothetical protein
LQSDLIPLVSPLLATQFQDEGRGIKPSARIKNHADDIEARLSDSALSIDWAKKENQAAVSGFKNAGEKILLIERDCDYPAFLDGILQSLHEK